MWCHAQSVQEVEQLAAALGPALGTIEMG
jgi:hypothetical protein